MNNLTCEDCSTPLTYDEQNPTEGTARFDTAGHAVCEPCERERDFEIALMDDEAVFCPNEPLPPNPALRSKLS